MQTQKIPTKTKDMTVEKIELLFKRCDNKQKLNIVETLWNNLLNNQEEIQSPDWHEPILKERMAELKNGKIKTSPWQEVKERLSKKLLCK